MNRGLRLFLILAIVIALVAVVVLVVLPTLNPPPAQPAPDGTQEVVPVVEDDDATPLPTATPIELVQIVVAVQELPRGFRITPDSVAVRDFPAFASPANAIADIDDVIGRIARTDIYREQPITTNLIVDDFTTLARVGSDAAAILPQDLVAVSLPVDRLTSVAYGVQDGDRVDLIVSMLFVDVDEIFQTIVPNRLTLFQITEEGGINFLEGIEGRPDSTSLGPVIVGPSERQRPRLVTQRTIQDALVVHVGNFPLDGRFIGLPPTPTPVPAEEEEADSDATPVPTPTPPFPDIVTLGVTPQDAVILTWMIEARVPVTLALRSAQGTSQVATNDVALEYIMSQFGIDLPGRFDYTIEPAIRSIRQLVAGNQISLSDGAATGAAAPPPAQ